MSDFVAFSKTGCYQRLTVLMIFNFTGTNYVQEEGDDFAVDFH